ncbi:MAG: hypothetical protein EBR90_01255 [Actinobacteria bacterium]|nr:hypothetical protein [Actinomycetota bacterium]
MSTFLNKLSEFGISPNEISKLIASALVEDLGGGVDITSTSTIKESANSVANFVARKNGVVSGLYVAAAVLESCNLKEIKVLANEGAQVKAGQVVIEVRGNGPGVADRLNDLHGVEFLLLLTEAFPFIGSAVNHAQKQPRARCSDRASVQNAEAPLRFIASASDLDTGAKILSGVRRQKFNRSP